MKINKEDPRFSIFGTKLSCLDLPRGYKAIVDYDFSKPGYVCFPSTNTIAYLTSNDSLREIYNESFITFADGKISEYYALLKGNKKTKNVSGLDLLNLLLASNLTHYFYGLSEKELIILEQRVKSDYPGAKVIGFKSPPWVMVENLYPDERILEDIKEINRLKPDLIWIGIGYPKQEYFMKYYGKHLNRGLMLGVGAVLLYKAGLVKTGPRWVKKIGMRWLVRLVQEPRRLWKRMMPGIIYFLYLVYKHDILLIKNKKN